MWAGRRGSWGTWCFRRGIFVVGEHAVHVCRFRRRGFPGDNGEIAFSKENYRNGTPGIFAVQRDGTGQDRLTSGTDYSPSYSADGQKAVFVGLSSESEMDFGQDIYVMDADGSNVQQVTDSRSYESSPSFSRTARP